jgi:ferredoxin-NADP reductase/Na+-translocating ferredoxin:NAD+ oxidoreductase RnfD subunit
MKRLIESFLNSMTMYRVTLYGLYLIVATAFGLSLFGLLSFSPLNLALSLAVLMLVSYGSNRLFVKLFRTAYNPESWQITALILFFLVFPQSTVIGYLSLGAVATIAMASKFVLAIRGRHIFNPAVIAVVISSLLGVMSATWWIATLYMLPVVSIVGFLVIWKLRHFLMVGIYAVTYGLLTVIIAKVLGGDIGDTVKNTIISGPIVFAASIMLLEPQTSPTTRLGRIAYSVLVGVLGGLQLGWISKPDVSIAVGNVFSFLLGAKRNIKLTFTGLRQIAPTTYEVTLQPQHPLRFKPGQYIELTLPTKKPDDRGVRRVFSIVSRPGDQTIRLGMVIPENPSTFKRTLLNLQPGEILSATQVGGSFTLPTQTERPIVLIAGGIGITPFLSMLDDLISRSEKRSITLFYAVRRRDLVVHADLLQKAINLIGLHVVLVVAEPTQDWKGESGYLTVDTIQKYVKDLYDRKIYISGPNAMVDMFQGNLRQLGVRMADIVTDYFTGY